MRQDEQPLDVAYTLGVDSDEQIARALRTPGTTVRISVPELPEVDDTLIPPPAPGATLELIWSTRYGSAPRVRFEGRQASPNVRFDEPTMRVRTWERQEVHLDGSLHVRQLVVEHAALVGAVAAERLTAAGAYCYRVMLGGIAVTMAYGHFDGTMLSDDSTVLVIHARNITLASTDRRQWPDVVVRDRIVDSELSSVGLDVEPGGLVHACGGTVVLRGCANGTVVGRRDRPLRVAVDFPTERADGLRPLDGAVLMDVAIAPGSLATIVSESDSAQILDPAPETIAGSLRDPGREAQTSLAELLHDRLGEKALRQQAVDAAALAVLDTRRRSSARHSSERLLLTAYWLLGYGRMLARPLAVWLAIVLVVLGLRVAQALDDPGGALSDRGAVRVDSSRPALVHAGGDVLAVVLLPITWAQGGSRGVEERVGLHGGYLPAVRLLMIVPLLAAAGGVRRRVRVRPHSDGR